jgi:hypothetical protein
VSCYGQNGNHAVLTGRTRDSNEPTWKYFLVEVWDHGQGRKATRPDAIRVLAGPTEFDCAFTNILGATVVAGELKVH